MWFRGTKEAKGGEVELGQRKGDAAENLAW